MCLQLPIGITALWTGYLCLPFSEVDTNIYYYHLLIFIFIIYKFVYNHDVDDDVIDVWIAWCFSCHSMQLSYLKDDKDDDDE